MDNGSICEPNPRHGTLTEGQHHYSLRDISQDMSGAPADTTRCYTHDISSGFKHKLSLATPTMCYAKGMIGALCNTLQYMLSIKHSIVCIIASMLRVPCLILF